MGRGMAASALRPGIRTIVWDTSVTSWPACCNAPAAPTSAHSDQTPARTNTAPSPCDLTPRDRPARTLRLGGARRRTRVRVGPRAPWSGRAAVRARSVGGSEELGDEFAATGDAGLVEGGAQ